MWPKALAQVLELAPHITRLVPMVDKMLHNRSANDEANRKALAEMSEGLHSDIGKMAASHAGLYRQINEQSEKLSSITADTRATRAAVDTLEERLARLERKSSLQTVLLTLATLLSAGSLTVLLILFAHHH